MAFYWVKRPHLPTDKKRITCVICIAKHSLTDWYKYITVWQVNSKKRNELEGERRGRGGVWQPSFPCLWRAAWCRIFTLGEFTMNMNIALAWMHKLIANLCWITLAVFHFIFQNGIMSKNARKKCGKCLELTSNYPPAYEMTFHSTSSCCK